MTEPTSPAAPYAPPPGQYASPVPGQYSPEPGQYPPGQAPYGMMPPPVPVKKSNVKRTLLTVGISVAVIAVIVIIGGIVTQNDPDNASVGSCMAGSSAETLKITDCKNADAKWTVVGKVTTSDEPSSDAASKDCDPWPSATADFYKGDSNGGYVLCLAPKS